MLLRPRMTLRMSRPPVRVLSNGLRVGGAPAIANSVVVVLPTITAPPLRKA